MSWTVPGISVRVEKSQSPIYDKLHGKVFYIIIILPFHKTYHVSTVKISCLLPVTLFLNNIPTNFYDSSLLYV